MSTLAGGCHCKNVTIAFTTSRPPTELPLRACQCSFCRRHGARTTSDPAGRARIVVADAAALARYRFGAKTADFLVCARCGVYVAPVMSSGGRTLATINVNALDDGAPFDRPAQPMDYDAESAEERVVRRLARWTPAELVIIG
jgi:hypothetical protein